MVGCALTDEEWQQVDAIDGWLFREEADLLASLNAGTWCEIGSWKGRSTYVLSLHHAGYAIDWFGGVTDVGDYDDLRTDTFREFVENINPHRSNVAILPMLFSQAVEFVKGPISLLFLDGEHSYKLTKQAFELLGPLVGVGGYVVFHDAWGNRGETEGTPFYEVTRFVLETANNPHWSHCKNLDTRRCAVFRKEKESV